jgi:hypothetical protein
MNPYPAAAFRVPTIEAWNRRERTASEPTTTERAPGLLERARGASGGLRRLAGTPAS